MLKDQLLARGCDHLQVGGRGRGVLGALVDSSARQCGSGLGALPVCGLPARGSARPRGRVQPVRGVLARGPPVPGGRGLAFHQARDH